VTRDEWLAARLKLLEAEKELTRPESKQTSNIQRRSQSYFVSGNSSFTRASSAG
jgi:predicted dithiol-disulfide oxidoreductase (DUF899 family)